MPKGNNRSGKTQGYYRLSPVSTAPTPHYAPLSSRPNLAIEPTYYSSQNLAMSQHQSYSQSPSGYSNGVGGPVQHPMTHHSQHQQYNQMAQQQTPQVSIRPSSGAWNPQDDQTLMQARAQGMNWAPIQQAYFPSKTPNACRKRHERLMERRNADDWDGMKLENMAKNYMSMRREIWSGLAACTGEKWNVVEQKCMSQGLKNLATSARACTRRERMHDTSSVSQHSAAGAVSVYGVGQGQNPVSYEHHAEDSGYADELEAEYDADGASDRSGGSVYQEHAQHSHGYSQSGGSVGMGGGLVGGMNVSGGMGQGLEMGLRGMDVSVRYAQHQSRLPSMDMGIDAIINRPAGR